VHNTVVVSEGIRDKQRHQNTKNGNRPHSNLSFEMDKSKTKARPEALPEFEDNH